MAKRKTNPEIIIDIFMGATKDEAVTLYGVATAIMKRLGHIAKRQPKTKKAAKPIATA